MDTDSLQLWLLMGTIVGTVVSGGPIMKTALSKAVDVYDRLLLRRYFAKNRHRIRSTPRCCKPKCDRLVRCGYRMCYYHSLTIKEIEDANDEMAKKHLDAVRTNREEIESFYSDREVAILSRMALEDVVAMSPDDLWELRKLLAERGASLGNGKPPQPRTHFVLRLVTRTHLQ